MQYILREKGNNRSKLGTRVRDNTARKRKMTDRLEQKGGRTGVRAGRV